MSSAYFFGYGSLVNLRSHSFAPGFQASAKGWRRAWVAVPERDVCFLTAVADSQSEIEGLIAPVPHGDWAALDQREAAYVRHANAPVDHAAPADQVAIYAIAPDRHSLPQSHNPILLSYLDVVIQGYLAQFGASGAARFFETTSGWTGPILNDRAQPRYARAQTLTPDEHDFVDTHLARKQVRIITAGDGTTT